MVKILTLDKIVEFFHKNADKLLNDDLQIKEHNVSIQFQNSI